MAPRQGWRGLVVNYNTDCWAEIPGMSESEERRRNWHYHFSVSPRREIGILIDREAGN